MTKNACFKKTITNIFVFIKMNSKGILMHNLKLIKAPIETNKNIEEKHRCVIESVENNGVIEFGYHFIKGRKTSSNYDYKTKSFISS